LRGKAAVLSYYEDGLRLLPDLRFTLVEVLTGVDQLTIVYRNQDDTLVAETLKLGDDGLVNAVECDVRSGIRRRLIAAGSPSGSRPYGRLWPGCGQSGARCTRPSMIPPKCSASSSSVADAMGSTRKMYRFQARPKSWEVMSARFQGTSGTRDQIRSVKNSRNAWRPGGTTRPPRRASRTVRRAAR